MKFDQKNIRYICEKALNDLKSKGVVVFKSEENIVLARMIKAFEDNLKDEERLNMEVKKLMAQYQNQASAEGVNSTKLFNMMKKELAKKKGFIL